MTRRDDQKAETKERVLLAAERVFQEFGYEAATIRRIANQAGLSTGAVFANFKDKAALYSAVYSHPPIDPDKARQLMLTFGPVLEAIVGGHGVEADQLEAARVAVEACRR